jgi:hypothetical protein
MLGSNVQQAFENGTATIPDAPTPKGKGEGTSRKATSKENTKAKASADEADESPSPEPKPRAPKRKRPATKTKSETPAAEKNDSGAGGEETAVANEKERDGDEEEEQEEERKPEEKRMRVFKKPESNAKTPAIKTRTPIPAPDMSESILAKKGTMHPNLLAELEAAVSDAHAHQAELATKVSVNGGEVKPENDMEMEVKTQAEEQVKTGVNGGEKSEYYSCQGLLVSC